MHFTVESADDFSYTHHDKTLLQTIIDDQYNEITSDIIIDEVLRIAMRHKNLFADLLTTPDINGLTPFYSALSREDLPDHIVTKLAEWLTFGVSMRFITKPCYASIHLAKNQHNEFPLLLLAKRGHPKRFGMCLQELQEARRNDWISIVELSDIVTEPNIAGYRTIDAALGSSCHKTVELMIKHAGITCFRANNAGITPVHHLVLNHQSLALEVCLIEINRAIERGQIPSTVYPELFLSETHGVFNRKHAFLSLSFHPDRAQTSQIILKYAEIAHIKNWLDVSSYRAFLTRHPHNTEGFSYLHEALRSSDYQNVYAYIGACLRAILDKTISLDSFREILQHENKDGYPVFHQSINNDFLETAELILNIFKTILPDEYNNVLFKRVKRIPRCENDKAFASEINALISIERQRIKNNVKTPCSLIYYRARGRSPSSDFLALMDLTHRVVEQEINETMTEYSSPTSIMRLLNTSPIRINTDTQTRTLASELVSPGSQIVPSLGGQYGSYSPRHFVSIRNLPDSNLTTEFSLNY